MKWNGRNTFRKLVFLFTKGAWASKTFLLMRCDSETGKTVQKYAAVSVLVSQSGHTQFDRCEKLKTKVPISYDRANCLYRRPAFSKNPNYYFIDGKFSAEFAAPKK